jgi:hypothetical protein
MTSLTVFDARCCDAAIEMYINTPSTKDCKFFIEGSERANDTFWNSDKTNPQRDIIVVKILENDGCGKFIYQKIPNNIIRKLQSFTSFEEILEISKKYFLDKKEKIIKRIYELRELCDEDEDEDISIDSMKSMLVFLDEISINFSIPTIVLNENGLFQITWKKDNSNLITLRFRNFDSVDYLIVKPSRYTARLKTLNQTWHFHDIIEFLETQSDLKKLIEGK